MAHRPLNAEKRLYLRPKINTKSNVWYTCQPIGINQINKSIKETLAFTVQPNNHTKLSSHSLRATTATRLYENNIEEQIIAEITGHSSSCVREYKRTNDRQREIASEFIQGTTIQTKKNEDPQTSIKIPKIKLSRHLENLNQWRITPAGDNDLVMEPNNVLHENCEHVSKKMTVAIDGDKNQIKISFQ